MIQQNILFPTTGYKLRHAHIFRVVVPCILVWIMN